MEKHTDILSTQLNGEKSQNKENYSNNYELIEKNQVEGTPFIKVKTEKGSCICLGNVRLTEWVDENVIEEHYNVVLKSTDWNFLFNYIVTIAERTWETKKIEEHSKELKTN